MQALVEEGPVHIREVWDSNLDEEICLIREIVDDYPYIAMDTEFPGVVLSAVGNFNNRNELNYRNLKANVDIMKLIQLGLTFSDEEGNLPTCGSDKGCIWQFNFREFDVKQHVFAPDSMQLLRQCGIDFDRNNKEGVNIIRFGKLIMSSGCVLNDNVQWVTFHGMYDFGYFLKLITCKKLPDTRSGFYDLISIFFPILHDIKYMMRFRDGLYGGLEMLAGLLGVERIGTGHQAGSDSLLTSCVFRKLKKDFFVGSLERFAGILYDLSVD